MSDEISTRSDDRFTISIYDIIMVVLIAVLIILFVDALYLIFKSSTFSQEQGKLPNSMMYEKSSLFFAVNNGVNFSLYTTQPLLIFLLWGHLGVFVGLLAERISWIELSYLSRRYLLLLSLPALTWNMLLLTERFKSQLLLSVVFLLVLLGIYTLLQYVVAGKVKFIVEEWKDKRRDNRQIWQVIIAQLSIYVIAALYLRLSYID